MASSQFHLLLEDQVTILEELNQLSLAKKEALLNNDISSLESIVLKEETLAVKLKKVADACSPQVRFFLSGSNTPSPLFERINATLKKIKQLVRELKLNNDLNQTLLRDELNLVQFTLNSFMSSTDAINTGVYSSTGKVVHNPKKVNLLNSKG